jgi:mono/diheme cytochrome c family protein
MKTPIRLFLLLFLSAILMAACTSPQVETSPTEVPVVEVLPTSRPPTDEPVEPTVPPVEVNPTSTTAPTEEPAQAGLSAEQLAEAKNVLNTNCATCHSTGRIASAQKDLASWKANIDRMIGKGAILTPEQAELIATYLAEGNKP